MTQFKFIQEIINHIYDRYTSNNIKCHYHIYYQFNGISFTFYHNKRRLRLSVNQYTQHNLDMLLLFIDNTVNNIDNNYIKRLNIFRYYFEVLLIKLEFMPYFFNPIK